MLVVYLGVCNSTKCQFLHILSYARFLFEKTWWDCVKNDMERLGLSQKDVQSRNKWRRIKGATG